MNGKLESHHVYSIPIFPLHMGTRPHWDHYTLHFIKLSAFQMPPTPKLTSGASTITCYTKYSPPAQHASQLHSKSGTTKKENQLCSSTNCMMTRQTKFIHWCHSTEIRRISQETVLWSFDRFPDSCRSQLNHDSIASDCRWQRSTNLNPFCSSK